MAYENPRRIFWNAPTTNVDGSAIDYELAYNLYVDGAGPVASFPGTLNPNGEYEFLFADLPTFPKNQVLTIALSAFSTANPTRESVPSTSVEVEFVGIPSAPFNVAVE